MSTDCRCWCCSCGCREFQWHAVSRNASRTGPERNKHVLAHVLASLVAVVHSCVSRFVHASEQGAREELHAFKPSSHPKITGKTSDLFTRNLPGSWPSALLASTVALQSLIEIEAMTPKEAARSFGLVCTNLSSEEVGSG